MPRKWHTPSRQTQMDNLSIGLHLYRLNNSQYGDFKEHIFRHALACSLDDPQSIAACERRFEKAQQVGRDARDGNDQGERVPGYFSFNAMPFGGQYVYKALSYIWVNPATGPLPSCTIASRGFGVYAAYEEQRPPYQTGNNSAYKGGS